MEQNSEKNRLILADIVAKTWNDDTFKKNLMDNPKDVLQKAGVAGIQSDTVIRVLENTATRKHLLISANATVSSVADYFEKIKHIPPGLELTFAQNSANLLYFVLPMRPAVSNIQLDSSHAMVLDSVGFEAVNMWTTANVAAEANVGAVQNVAGATEVAAVAVAIAVMV